MSLTITVIIILLFLAFFYAAKRNARLSAEVVSGAKILVCSLGAATRDDLEDADAEVYSAYYQQVDVEKGFQVDALMSALGARGYDVLHLFCELDEKGDLVGEHESRLKARDFYEACLRHDIKLLIFAGDNSKESYSEFNEVVGGSVDVVMTLRRDGDKFAFFLGELLKRMAAGKTLGRAWLAVSPQRRGPQHNNLPVTGARLDRGNVVLLP